MGYIGLGLYLFVSICVILLICSGRHEAEVQVKGYSNAIHKKFNTYAAAQDFCARSGYFYD